MPSKAIKSIKLDRWNSVTEEIFLSRYVLFLGPNGAGKSAILDAYRFAVDGSHEIGSRPQAIAKLCSPSGGSVEVRLEGEEFRFRRSIVPDYEKNRTSMPLTIHGREDLNPTAAQTVVRETCGYHKLLEPLYWDSLSDEDKRREVVALCRTGNLLVDQDAILAAAMQEYALARFGLRMGFKYPSEALVALNADLTPKEYQAIEWALRNLKTLSAKAGDILTPMMLYSQEQCNSTKKRHEELVAAHRQLAIRRAEIPAVSDTLDQLREKKRTRVAQKSEHNKALAGAKAIKDAIAAAQQRHDLQVKTIAAQRSITFETEESLEARRNSIATSKVIIDNATPPAFDTAMITAAEEAVRAADIAAARAAALHQKAIYEERCLRSSWAANAAAVDNVFVKLWELLSEMDDTPLVDECRQIVRPMRPTTQSRKEIEETTRKLSEQIQQSTALVASLADELAGADRVVKEKSHELGCLREAEKAWRAACDQTASAVREEKKNVDAQEKAIAVDAQARRDRDTAIRQAEEQLKIAQADIERLTVEVGSVDQQMVEMLIEGLDKTIAGIDAQIDTKNKEHAAETLLSEAIASANEADVAHRVWSHMFAALKKVRNRFMADLSKPLVDRMQMLCDLITRDTYSNDQSQAVEKSDPGGWIIDLNLSTMTGAAVFDVMVNKVLRAQRVRVSSEALSKGERCMFRAILLLAIADLVEIPLKVIALQMGELDALQLQRLLAGIQRAKLNVSHIFVESHVQIRETRFSEEVDQWQTMQVR